MFMPRDYAAVNEINELNVRNLEPDPFRQPAQRRGLVQKATEAL
jgi:hypothetical protein